MGTDWHGLSWPEVSPANGPSCLAPREVCSVGQEGSPAVPRRNAVSGTRELPTWQLQQPCRLGSCLHRLLRDGCHLSHVIGAKTLHAEHTLTSDWPEPPWAQVCQCSWCRMPRQLGTLQLTTGMKCWYVRPVKAAACCASETGQSMTADGQSDEQHCAGLTSPSLPFRPALARARCWGASCPRCAWGPGIPAAGHHAGLSEAAHKLELQACTTQASS